MDGWKAVAGVVGVGVNSVLEAVPSPVAVIVVLVACCGPELRTWVEMVDRIAWRWRGPERAPRGREENAPGGGRSGAGDDDGRSPPSPQR